VEVILSEKIALVNNTKFCFDNDTSKRSKLSLKNFDRKLFLLFGFSGLAELSSEYEVVDPLQSWYDFIVLCLLKAGAILYDLGNKTGFSNGKIHTVPLKKIAKSKQEAILISP